MKTILATLLALASVAAWAASPAEAAFADDPHDADPARRRAFYEGIRPQVPDAQRTFYVDAAAGDDAAAGTEQAPWRSLAKANQEARPGDRFHLRGDFAGQSISPAQKGTAEAWIQYARWPGADEPPIVRGGDKPPAVIGKLAHCRFEGIAFTRRVWLDRGTRDVVLIDCRFTGGGVIGLRATDVWIERCEFSGIGGAIDEATGVRKNSGDGIFLMDGCQGVVVFDSSFERCGHAAIAVTLQRGKEPPNTRTVAAFNRINNTWAGGVNLSGHAHDSLIEHNTIWGSGTDEHTVAQSRGGINVRGMRNEIRYNLIYGTDSSGIFLQTNTNFDHEPQHCSGHHIHHNTVYRCGGVSLGLLGDGAQTKIPVTLRDNVIERNLIFDCSQPRTHPRPPKQPKKEKEDDPNRPKAQPEVSITIRYSSDFERFRPDADTVAMNGNLIRDNCIVLTRNDDPLFAYISEKGKVPAKFLTLEEFNAISGGGNIDGPAPDFVSLDPQSEDFLYLPKTSALVGKDGRALYGIPMRVR